MTEIERFRETVEKFIASKGMTPTQFGREYAADPLFVFQLRDGREPRTPTRQRILEAIAAPKPEKEQAA
ncbi:hypothetical protein ASD64_01450 [Mesorhizobium sp. Root157]|uniref:hypothetical protein n=1 Tax=Mesorhizobium sp. Root157 TaxID=1736477 RepID=UPI0006F2F8C0|nr:hypothetical protein [Mesorhizobium sp. Root157]KRA00266.1 hypothetical protein ASD64_01450 [Mesorhizobium sp. Root157]